MTFYNIARMYTTTTGDSDVTLTTAVPGCKSFADVGVADSEVIHYGIISYNINTHRPEKSEVGIGKYIASGTVLKRTTVEVSTDSDDGNIDLSGLAEVYLCPIASDFNGFGGGGMSFAMYWSVSVDSVPNAASGQTLTINTEVVDADNIATLSGNTITLAGGGYYEFSALVSVAGGAAMNGTLLLELTGGYSVEFYYPTASGLTSANLFLPPTIVQKNANDTLTIELSNSTGGGLDAAVVQVAIKKLS